jgi:hypothetical protein
LYRRENNWEHRHPVVAETTTGQDGEFRIAAKLQYGHDHAVSGFHPYVIIADKPGLAFGWKTITGMLADFSGDLILTSPTERKIAVVDEEGHPVEGAKVTLNGVGDDSASYAPFQDYVQLRPDDGPLTAITDRDGNARFAQLPMTIVSFVAAKPGFAETFAFREQDSIHLTSSAALSGRVVGPDGSPVGGAKVVLFTAFMWSFEYATSDAYGRYRFKDLRARGWDMRAWKPDEKGNGTYRVWIDSDRFAAPTQTVTLEPKGNQTLDINCERAGVIRVSVAEQGTDEPIAGARVWGFDTETASSARFNAYTNERGIATFYSAPAKITFSIAGPPPGIYVATRGPGNPAIVDFRGGEAALSLKMSPIAGPLITLSGICALRDGTAVRHVTVNASAGSFTAAGVSSYIRPRQTDDLGRFSLEGVPGGRQVHLYAESGDRALAAATSVSAGTKSDPANDVTLTLSPTKSISRELMGDDGKPLASRKIVISPNVLGEDFRRFRRAVSTDEQGRLRIDGILPGMTYRVQEEVAPRAGPINAPGGRRASFNDLIELAPTNGK